MATTNEQIIDRIDRFEINVNQRFDVVNKHIEEVDEESKKRDTKLEEDIKHNDDAIRGNGKEGLKAQVAANKKVIEEIKWYFRGVTAAVIIDLVTRLVHIS